MRLSYNGIYHLISCMLWIGCINLIKKEDNDSGKLRAFEMKRRCNAMAVPPSSVIIISPPCN